MHLIRTILYNASIISFFHELNKKYPYPIIIHEATADSLQRVENSDIYRTLDIINSHWITKSLDYDPYVNDVPDKNEFNFLHVFCVEKISDSIYLILDKILKISNSFRIQNVILVNQLETNAVTTTDIFARHGRLHRNTLVCERETRNITCWRWIYRDGEDDRNDKTLTDVLNESIDLNSLELQINADNSAPMAFTPCFAGRFIFTGLDAMVTAEILSRFNATPRYCNKRIAESMRLFNCDKKGKMDERDALKLIRQLKVNEKIRNDHAFFHTVFDSRMIKYLFFERGECNGPKDLKMNTGTMSPNGNSMKGLSPTDFSCISIIVSKADAASSFLRRTFYNSVESLGFICTVLLFTIGRMLICRTPFKQCFDIFYTTFVVFLTQSNLSPKTNAERILYGLLLFTSVVTTVMLSGLIFTNLVNNPSSKPIQTLNDLVASNYKIIAMNDVGNWIENLRADIREKVVVANFAVVKANFLALDKSSVYAIDENMYKLFKINDGSPNMYKVTEYYYEMAEKVHCGYLSYLIANNLPLENEINQILQSMVDHGFISAFKKWSLHILKLNLYTFSFAEENNPLSLVNVNGVFYAYFMGIGISAIVLLCEVMVKMFARIRVSPVFNIY